MRWFTSKARQAAEAFHERALKAERERDAAENQVVQLRRERDAARRDRKLAWHHVDSLWQDMETIHGITVKHMGDNDDA